MASNGEGSNIVEMKRTMILYCMNTLRRRTIDERLGDLSAIMKSSLVLEIAYDASELQVTYSIGSQHASVSGSDESTCVRRCKRELLRKLILFSTFTKSIAQDSSLLLESRCYKTRSSSTTFQDAYSEIELCKDRGTENAARKTFGDIVLADPETDIPRPLCDYVHGNRSPLLLKIVYLPTDWEIVTEIGPYNASAKCSRKYSCMHQCKKHLLHELAATVDDARVASSGGDKVVVLRQPGTSSSGNTFRTISFEGGDSLQAGKRHVSASVDGKSRGNTLSESVKATNPPMDTDGSNQSTSAASEVSRNKIIDTKKTMVQNGSDGEVKRRETDNKANERAAAESAAVAQLPETTGRTDVSTGSPAGTRLGEKPRKSFDKLEGPEKYVAQAAAVLRNVARDTVRQSYRQLFDILVQTSRANRFYMKNITDCIVTNAIDMPRNCAIYAEMCCDLIEKAWVDARAFQLDLVQSCRDVLRTAGVLPEVDTARRPRNGWKSERRFDEKARERSLGTCRLMGEIFMRGQMFRTMSGTVNTFMRSHDAHSLECLCILLTIIGPRLQEIINVPRRVFEQLERYMDSGYAGNCRLPQRTVDMIQTVLGLRQCCSTSWDSWQDYFAERKTFEENRRGFKPQPVDHHTPGPGILRCPQNQPYNSTKRSKRNQKSITFNPVVSILCYRRDQ